MEQTNNLKIPQEILENLRPFNRHIDCLCLECGYKGLMGLADIKRPFYARGFFLLIFLVIGVSIGVLLAKPIIVGAITGIVLVILRHSGVKRILMCPSCKNEIQV